jgi:hypothetical protein
LLCSTTLPQPPIKLIMGTHSAFTQEIADNICLQLIEGKSLRTICLNEDTPALSTVMLWISSADSRNDYKLFSEQYARAREMQADTLADEILSLSDEADAKNAHAIRVRVDARKWVASKLKPKVYGDKIDLAVSGDVNIIVKDNFK